jgi:Asp-tRNA(Asn)/Glu-tRNA(Gln) amidotransferase A subunit family amidase
MIDDLSNLDGIAQAQLVKTGEVTALELVDAAIARIEAIEPKVHALAGVNFDAARKRARECPQGPLGGVPFLVKDLIAYPGLRHSMGSRLFAGNIATQPTPYSQRLDAAGVIVLGKQQPPSLACWEAPKLFWRGGDPKSVGPEPFGRWVIGRSSRSCGQSHGATGARQ